MASHTAAEVEHEGFPAVALTAGDADVRTVFVPSVGMVGASLRHRGDELLGQRGGLRRYAETGSSMGIPLLHPWANRLAGLRYEAGGREVALDPQTTGLRLDGDGLPIHGLLTASRLWQVASLEADGGAARLEATLDFAARPELMAGFPFAHELRQRVTLAGATLSVETTLTATGDTPVPVCFGHHPYVRVPGVPRDEWNVALPVLRRAHLDERGIPTGETEAAADLSGPLGVRAFDDLFVELDEHPRFSVSGGARTVSVSFDEDYPVAQVYAPVEDEFICFEPMTAPTNALVAGGPALRAVSPGEQLIARFSISVA